MENHKTERTEEMISMYENITKIATGSYGLLYYLDDEDEVYSDEFRVLVSKKGKCEWKRDENFSPCSIMIEEFPVQFEYKEKLTYSIELMWWFLCIRQQHTKLQKICKIAQK